MPRAVAWPMLLRPPLRCFPSVSALTGLPFHRLDRSISTRPRWAGLVGLYCFSAIFLESCRSDTGGHIDGLAFGQRHDRLLHVGTLIGLALPALCLALHHQGRSEEHTSELQSLMRNSYAV